MFSSQNKAGPAASVSPLLRGRAALCTALLCGLLTSSLHAAEHPLPYDAIVQQDDVYARSGPGRAYYPTSRLKAGDTVRVVRHDPGGWYVIVPPPGSFSWVPARFVEKTGAQQGSITQNNVPAWVGSFESDIREVEQRRLKKGDEVEILGEKMLRAESGQLELWYKIQPPRFEWRWILGQYVVAADALPGKGQPLPDKSGPAAKSSTTKTPGVKSVSGTGTSAADQTAGKATLGAEDLSSGSETARSRIAGGVQKTAEQSGSRPADDGADPAAETEDSEEDSRVPPLLAERPLVRLSTDAVGDIPSKVVRSKEGQLTEKVAEAELRRLDAKLQSILELDKSEWEFDELIEEYEALKAEGPGGAFEAYIQRQLTQIGRHQREKHLFDERKRLAEETERRDQELAMKLQSRPASSSTTPAPTAGAMSAGGVRPPVATPVKFDGAGIVQRVGGPLRPGGPRFALMSPQGKLLAYLVPDGPVALNAWQGKAVGVLGARKFDPAVGADVIRVKSCTAVRLGP